METNAKLEKKVSFFISELYKWQQRLDLGYIEIDEADDLKCDAICMVELYRWIDTDQFFPVIYYNPKAINKCNKADILQTALHEVAHIHLKHIYESDKSKIKFYEYEAESFAIGIIKKEYKRFYKTALRNLERWTKCESNIYRDVAKMILKKEVVGSC